MTPAAAEVAFVVPSLAAAEENSPQDSHLTGSPQKFAQREQAWLLREQADAQWADRPSLRAAVELAAAVAAGITVEAKAEAKTRWEAEAAELTARLEARAKAARAAEGRVEP